METLPQHQAHPSIAFNDSTLNFNSMSTANADQDRNAGIRAVHLKKKKNILLPNIFLPRFNFK